MFLQYSKVNWLYVFTYPLGFGFPSHLGHKVFFIRKLFWSLVFVTADDIALSILCKGSGLFSPYLLDIYAV